MSSRAMPKLHLALVGAGLIGPDHVLTLRRHPLVGGISVFDAEAARAEKLAGEFGLKRAGSLDELVAGCDLVWICTPPFAHREPVEAAAAARKPIFCEKPLASSMDD